MGTLEGYRRYAIYFAPEKGGALARFAASWLGYDAETGETLARPEVEGLPAPIESLTTSPARYGFHGTLKAPFRLAEGTTPAALDAALAEFAANEPVPEPMPLKLGAGTGFVAFRPAEPVPAFDALAFRIVQAFEPFRAPLNGDELDRRLRAPLSARQRDLLEAWGYPYVDDQFRFHMTLSNRQSPEDAAAIIEALTPHVAGLIRAPMPIRDLCLFGDPGEGRPFRLLTRHPIGAA